MKIPILLAFFCLVFPVRAGNEAIFPDEVGDWLALDADGFELEVPYVPTPMAVVHAMLEMARVGADDIVYDLGCGDGRIPIAAADYYGARGVGVDLDPRRIEEAKQNAGKVGVAELVEFRVADIFETDFSEATVVTLFLLQDANIRLRPLLLRQLRPGSRIVSHEFDLGDWKPDHELVVLTDESLDHRIFLWLIPTPMEGLWSGEIEAGANRLPFMLDLEQNFQMLSGAGELDYLAVPITNGRMWGKGFVLDFKPALEGEKIGLRLLGRVEGNRAEGLALVEKGRWAGIHPWTATRSR